MDGTYKGVSGWEGVEVGGGWKAESGLRVPLGLIQQQGVSGK